MSKHSGKIGLYLLLIVALIAGYLYLNDQVSTQGSYTMGQLEKALEEDKVTDAVIHQNREVPTGYVTANIVSDGQRTVYVTDVKEAEELLEKYDIDPQCTQGQLHDWNSTSGSAYRRDPSLFLYDDEPADVRRRRKQCEDDELRKKQSQNVYP